MSNRKTFILFAEDEPILAKLIVEELESNNFEIKHCLDGRQAVNEFRKRRPDLIILDVMMPEKDGFTAAREIRTIDLLTPIIFLTSKSQSEDTVKGFKSGGNDYIKKPFNMEELLLRIDNLLHFIKKEEQIIEIEFGKYIFNFHKEELVYDRKHIIKLTHRESELLFEFLKKKNQVIERKVILNKLWGNDDFFAARSLDVFITRLRKKISRDDSIQLKTIHGLGYRLMY